MEKTEMDRRAFFAGVGAVATSAALPLIPLSLLAFSLPALSLPPTTHSERIRLQQAAADIVYDVMRSDLSDENVVLLNTWHREVLADLQKQVG